MNRRVMTAAATTAAVAAATVPVSMSVAEAGTVNTWCRDKQNVAVLGASTEAGKGLPDYENPGDGGYDPTEYGWVSQISELSRAAWGTEVHNYSHSGATVADYEDGGRWDDTVGAVDDMFAYGADLMVIDLGANEFMTGMPPERYEKKLRDLIGRARTERDVDVLLVGHWRIAMQKDRPWSAYMAAQYRVARDMDASLIDFTQLIDATDKDSAGLWADDGVHLSAAGQSVVTGAIWSWMLFSCGDQDGGE